MSRAPSIRCAIYTRKSSEEGLEQEFNSLHAQREACAAYIKSQTHEGWSLVKKHYDDGGYSGGTIDRPGLQALMEDISQKRVDVIVVYKIDRLTRSLSDFARLADEFDAYGVSFVSVTQQFNTTNSMGRLMLNVLLSFAQFEREVTGERIRDKIAASKKKGMWMGGMPPLGYDVKDRGLVINPTEAETVRTLFRLYLEHGSIATVKWEARKLGIVSKKREFETGRTRGGIPMGVGHLYKLIQNPVYAGKVRHGDALYEGQHEAIIDPETWEAVQARLGQNRHDHRTRSNARFPSLLAGLLFSEDGYRFGATHTERNGQRNRYYVERIPDDALPSLNRQPVRMPAMQIEKLVRKELLAILSNPARLLETLGPLPASQTEPAIRAGLALAAELEASNPHDWVPIVQQIIARVVLGPETIVLEVSRNGLRVALALPASKTATHDNTVEITIHAELESRGSARKLIINGWEPVDDPEDILNPRALARGYDWFLQLVSGEVESVKEIAALDSVTPSFVGRLVRNTLREPGLRL